MMMLFTMMLCMSNLNVIGLQFTNHHALASKLNLFQMLMAQDVDVNPDMNVSKLDDIVDIIDHLVDHQTTKLSNLRKNVNDTKHVYKNAKKAHYDAFTTYLRANDVLVNTDLQTKFDDAVVAENNANETAIESNLTLWNTKDALIKSDLGFEIASLRSIRSLVHKLLTGTHMPTKAPTLSPTTAPTIAVPVRLTEYPRGRLEVKTDNGWNEVCGLFFWDNSEGAISACKALGYARGGNVTKVEGGNVTDSIYVGECLPGELPGSCTGRCCVDAKDAPGQHCRNKVNCGVCASGHNVAAEIQCFGPRWPVIQQ